MGVFTQSGGFEVARTEERMEELRRRMSSAKAWGIEAELVSPEFVKEKVPFLDTDQIIGAFWTPGVGVVDSLRAGTIMRERALAHGRADRRTRPSRSTGLDVEDGPASDTGCAPTGGDIEAETVVIACGVWSPKIGDMAGVSIPLTPAVHQMISVGPCPQLAEREGEISFPIVRDMDTFCYERQHGADMEVGSYAHRAILHEPEDIPSIEQAKLSPTEMPFTSDDFDPQLEQAYELMPELLGAEGAEMRYAINGLLSLTCDGCPILGESQVKGLWTAAAVWIKEGPGVGRAVAEWMTHGHSEIDVSHSDIARFHPHQKRREHTRLRTTESFIKTYGIIHPAEQYESDRDQRLVADARLAAEARRGLLRDRRLGAAVLVRVQRRPARGVRRRGDAARARVGLALVEPDHQRRAPADARGRRRDRPVGVPDLRHRRVPGALDTVQRTCVAQCDVAVGKVIYTPVLDANGGFRSDLTVMRLGDDHFRVVTGGAHGMADRQVVHRPPARRRRARRSPTAPTRSRTIGLWGPRARDILVLAHRRRRLRRGLRLPDLPRDRRSAATSPCSPRGSPTSASSAGSSTSPMDDAAAAVGGAARGRRAARRGARRHRRLRHDRPHREGLPRLRLRARRRAHHRRGRHAAAQGQGGRLRRPGGLPRASARQAPQTVLCTLTVDDHTSASRHEALHARRRADPDPRRRHPHRRPRPPPLRHHRRARRRRWASTCCWPTCRPTRPRSATSSPCPTWRSSTRSPSARSTRPPLLDPGNERMR